MTSKSCLYAGLTFIAALTVSVTDARAAGDVYGNGRIPKVLGSPVLGYAQLYEFNVFLSPSDDAITGPYKRLGLTRYSGSDCYDSNQGDGAYCIPIQDGTYSLLMHQPEFYGRGRVVPDVVVAGADVQHHVDPPLDFSTYIWKDTGATWTGLDNTWYQTFTATGLNITDVGFVVSNVVSGYSGDVSILEDNGNPDVRLWNVLGTRRDYTLGRNTDNAVRWRSGEIPTVPGRQYAVKITGVGVNLQPYKRDKDLLSYGAQDPNASGQAYNGNGVAQNFDLNVVVFSDNDGTIAPVCKRTEGIGTLLEGYFSDLAGQTFTPTISGSLAAVDVWAAGAENKWDITFTWRVREGGPTGPQIGPTKRTNAAAFAAGVGLHGVSYNALEVPLLAGNTYFIEFEAFLPPAQSPGFNTLISDDPFPGNSYHWAGTWVARPPNDDIAMTIMQYVPRTVIALNKTQITRTAYMGDPVSADTFTVVNAGNDTLNYTITDDVTWLSTTPDSGSSFQGDPPDTITIDYTPQSLPVGTHTATISVEGNAVNTPQEITVTLNVHTVKPDLDGDDDVDSEDFGLFQACMTMPGVMPAGPVCEQADFDNDDDVDAIDFTVVQGCLKGAEVPPVRNCAG